MPRGRFGQRRCDLLEPSPIPPRRSSMAGSMLAQLAAEIFASAINPYPRKHGAEFDWRDPKAAASEAESRPFAALAKLKGKPLTSPPERAVQTLIGPPNFFVLRRPMQYVRAPRDPPGGAVWRALHTSNSGKSMRARVTIALDAMGGDQGPSMAIPGAALSLVRHPDSEFLLFGDQPPIAAILEEHQALAANSRIIHAEMAIAMDAKPSQALRRGAARAACGWRSMR